MKNLEELFDFVYDLDSIGIDTDFDVVHEIADHVYNGEKDFESGGYRFIEDSVIDEILADEMASDPYVLGSFDIWTISQATGWPTALIEAAQKGEAYQEIGKAMSMDQIERLAEIYAGCDGYGHHFATYDGNEHEITIDDTKYYVFRVD